MPPGLVNKCSRDAQRRQGGWDILAASGLLTLKPKGNEASNEGDSLRDIIPLGTRERWGPMWGARGWERPERTTCLEPTWIFNIALDFSERQR